MKQKLKLTVTEILRGQERIKLPGTWASLFFLSQLCLFEMFFETMSKLGSWPWVSLCLWLRTGSPSLKSSAGSSCPQLSREGLGGGRARGEAEVIPPGPPRKEPPSGMGYREGEA